MLRSFCLLLATVCIISRPLLTPFCDQSSVRRQHSLFHTCSILTLFLERSADLLRRRLKAYIDVKGWSMPGQCDGKASLHTFVKCRDGAYHMQDQYGFNWPITAVPLQVRRRLDADSAYGAGSAVMSCSCGCWMCMPSSSLLCIYKRYH